MALVSKIEKYKFDVEFKGKIFIACLNEGFKILNGAMKTTTNWKINFPAEISKKDKKIVEDYLNNYQGSYEAETITIF